MTRPVRTSAHANQMEAGAIFISYASDDLAAAEQITTALKAAGLAGWYDKRQLEAGDDWDQKTRQWRCYG